MKERWISKNRKSSQPLRRDKETIHIWRHLLLTARFSLLTATKCDLYDKAKMQSRDRLTLRHLTV